MQIFTSSGRSRDSGSGCRHDGCPNSSFILHIVSCLAVGNDVLAGSDVVTIIPCDCRDLSPATPGDSPSYTESTEITFTTRASIVSFCGVIVCVTRCSVTSTSTQFSGLVSGSGADEYSNCKNNRSDGENSVSKLVPSSNLEETGNYPLRALVNPHYLVPPSLFHR